MESYSSFKNEWQGRRVDYDHVYRYQCVDLILEYLKEVCNIPTGVWGNAIDYATHPTPTFAEHFEKVSSYQPGDIVVLYGKPGNPYGHIGIFDHQDGSGVWLLEQNMGGSGDGLGRNAIGVYRAIPTSRIAVVWRYKGTMPAPTGKTVFLPSAVDSWRLYDLNVAPVKGNEKAFLRPSHFPPGLTYPILGYHDDGNTVEIQTQMFGRGKIWVTDTEAVIK